MRTLSTHLQMLNEPIDEKSRLKSELCTALRRIGVSAIVSLASRPVLAKTFFDTDVYGDKELKIGICCLIHFHIY